MKWTKMALAGVVALAGVGGLAAMHTTCIDDSVVHILTLEPRGQRPGNQNPDRYFSLDNESFSRLPQSGQNLITMARDTGRSVTVDWDTNVARTVETLQNVSEHQTGDPFVYVFRWSEEFFLYSEQIEVGQTPFYCV